MSVCLSICLSVYLSICLPIYPSPCQSLPSFVSFFFSVALSLSIFIPITISISTSFLFSISISMLSIYLKGSNSARFLSKVEVGRTKTKQFCETCSKKMTRTTKFCETSSIFEIDSSEAVVFLPCSPPNMLRATAACTV